MILTDTHSHLYATEFEDDIEKVLQRAADEDIQRIYLPAIDSTRHQAMITLEEKHPTICTAMMGLHPCYVKENYKQELQVVEKWLSKKNFVAIGEIGLDFYWDTSFSSQQHEVFEIQMQWALEKNLPIVIHTRSATKETIAAVAPFAKKGLTGIFHCFSGTYETAKQIIDMNFYLGIGGVLTYKKSGLAEVIKDVDIKHLVLETDAPYLTPVPFRGKRNESSYLKYIAGKLAEVKNITVEEVAAATTANAQKIFGC
jgi:TatD DNase family protein